MSLTFHRKPIKFSANTLETLLAKYQPYTEEILPTGEDSTKYEEYCSAINLIIGGIKIIKSSQEHLQSLVDKLEKAYEESKTKGNKKDLVNEVEEIDQQCQFSEKIAKANETIFVLQARINEYRDKVHKLALKLGIDPHKSHLSATNMQDNNKKKDSTSDESIDPELAQWLSDDASDNSADREDIACRTLKPKQMNLPRFYGDEEEFPEYWAIFETLVNDNKVLNTVEKMLLLRDSLRGRAETAIKGIQLIPQNYKWMTEELKKKFGNKPANRAKIVQKLIDMRAANNSAESCMTVYDKIRMLINQMVSAGQDIRAIQDALWTEKILEKFPYNIVKSVLIAIQNRENVTVDDVMNEIEKEITAKKFVETRLRNRPRFEEVKKRESQPREEPKKSILKSCIFCSQTSHPSAYCKTVTDIHAKRGIVKDRKLCWKCFSGNHTSFDCSWSNCPQCGQQHNKSLCVSGTIPPQSRDSNRSNRTSGGNRLTPQRPTTDSRPHKEPWRNQQSDVRHNSNQANIHTTKGEAVKVEQYTDEHMQRRKEQIVLMTAVGNIWNYNTKKFEQLLFFFDSGAQKTIIKEDIADKFGLPITKTETCTMSGIGGHVEKFESKFVNLRISDAYGEEFNLQIHTPTAQINTRNKEIILSSTEAEVILALQSNALINVSEYVIKQPCEIHFEKILGCYECMEGAQIQISCKTDIASWITIQCEEQTFSIECNPANKNTTVNLNFNYAVIQKNCHTICDGKQKNIVMEGTLTFHEMSNTGSIFNEKDTYVSQPFHWLQSLRIPDIQPLLHNMKKYWKVTLMSALAVMTAVGLTYVFGPIIIVVLIKILPIIAIYIAKSALAILKVAWISIRFTISATRRVKNYVNQLQN